MYESQSRTPLPITIDREIMSGMPVFAGTRVPIQTLFDYLMDGCELAAFLDNFPSVSQEAALTILAYASSQVTVRWRLHECVDRRKFTALYQAHVI